MRQPSGIRLPSVDLRRREMITEQKQQTGKSTLEDRLRTRWLRALYTYSRVHFSNTDFPNKKTLSEIEFRNRRYCSKFVELGELSAPIDQGEHRGRGLEFLIFVIRLQFLSMECFNSTEGNQDASPPASTWSSRPILQARLYNCYTAALRPVPHPREAPTVKKWIKRDSKGMGSFSTHGGSALPMVCPSFAETGNCLWSSSSDSLLRWRTSVGRGQEARSERLGCV